MSDGSRPAESAEIDASGIGASGGANKIGGERGEGRETGAGPTIRMGGEGGMPDSRGGQGALERDMRAGARTGSGRSGEAERRSGRAGSTEVGTGDSAQESNLH